MASILVAGAAFGAALTASGVYHPSSILDQLTLTNSHMLETFMAAAATSSIVLSITQQTGFTKFKPRSFSPLGIFTKYDGNIIGGSLLGVGMALSGSCPGTVLAQIGAGIRGGLPSLGGGLLAGIVWSGLIQPRLRSRKLPASISEAASPVLSVYEAFGISPLAATALFEAVLVAALAALVTFSPEGPLRGLVTPVTGGVLIGASQLVSVVLRRAGLGVSTAYEEFGQLVWGQLEGGKPKVKNMLFAAGTILGAAVLTLAFGTAPDAPAIAIPALRSALGGFCMVLGARIAGGCTSGHGITGMSLLSISSFITVAFNLGMGVVTARLLM